MILIYHNTTNKVALTLSEKTTISTPTYLFSFTNVQTQYNITFIADDTSCNTDRFNLFDIIENTTQDRLNGTVTLHDVGQWDYTVYAQSSTTNLDVTLADETVETGMVKVLSGASDTDTTYTLDEIDVQYDPE